MTDTAADAQPRYGRITEAGLEQLRARMGKPRPITQPYNREVTRDAILHYARGIGDENPLWLDEEYARSTKWGGIIAPPCFLYSVHGGSWDMRRGHGLPGVHGLHASDRWDFLRPVRVGDQLSGERILSELTEKHGSFAGRQSLQTYEINFKNQRDEHVATCYLASMRTERDEARRGKYNDLQLAHYTEEDIKEIETAYDAEIVRGSDTRYWEDVTIGEELQPMVKGPLTSADCIAWVMGVGSPHIRAFRYFLDYRRRTPAIGIVNPETGVPEPVERVHWDNYMAQEAGLPAAYDYGSQRGALASHLMTNWMGDDGFLKILHVYYRGMNFLGDTLWFRGRVVDKYTAGPNQFVDCEITGINQRGDVIAPGRAVVALPSRERGPVVFPVELNR
jgi:acyl dehydratase